ncbi:MAG: hypothetical protein WD990_11640 [Acidimicrobiia bacterium]
MLAHTELLSWSAQQGATPVDLRGVVDPTVDPLVAAGRALVSFVDSMLTDPVDSVRTDLEAEVGRRGLATAAAVLGNFQMMNRVADATGMPVGTGSRRRLGVLIDDLELDRFDHQDEET